MINFNEMEKIWQKQVRFFQGQMSSSGEERTFVIGLLVEKGISVDCKLL